jgi:hypothetical protein
MSKNKVLPKVDPLLKALYPFIDVAKALEVNIDLIRWGEVA